MEDHHGLFAFIRGQKWLSANIALFVIVSMLVPTSASAIISDPFRNTRDAIDAQLYTEPDNVPNGAFNYSAPIAIPPGRNGVQPNIQLSYSSSPDREGSPFGYGWSVNIPYIERANKIGVDKLYNQTKTNSYFYSTLSGELAPVVSTSPTGSFLGFASNISRPSFFSSFHKLALLDEPVAAPIDPVTDASSTGESVLPPPPDPIPDSLPSPSESVTPTAVAPTSTDVVPTGSVATSTSLISDQIKNIPAGERAAYKGRALAQLGSIPKTRKGDYWIEVQQMESIEGGVQVLARAWDANDSPIGFGRDGSVEIERFRIINPPIMIPDGTTRIFADERLGHPTEIANFKEDLTGALLQVLADTIAVKKEKFDATNILQGKTGNTTTTVYPDPGSATSTDDSIQNNQGGSTWANQINTSSGAYALYGPTSVQLDVVEFRGMGSASSWLYNTRGYFHFDTSSIPNTDSISGATLSLYGTLTALQGSNDPTIGIFQSTVTSDNTISANATDWAAWGTTLLSDTVPAASSWSTTGYNDFPLNASGIALIAKDGVTKYNTRANNYDQGATEPPTNTTGDNLVRVYAADQTGTTNDPKLVIEHSVATNPSSPTGLQVELLTNPTNVATSNPRFSAVHENASTTALATSYQIQISTSTSFSSPYWDSAKQTLSSSTPQSQRSPQVFSTTTFALDGATYYWRIRFFDQTQAIGDWSVGDTTFRMAIAGEYAAKVDDGSFMRYTLGTDNKWTAYDKRGVMYRFGHSSSTQLASSATTTFRWYLEEMRDPNGNSMTYCYATTSVATGYTSQLYPYKITYTANGASAGIGEVEFVREDRSDIATSSYPGFPIVTTQRIKEVLVRTNGQLTHRYQLSYGTGDNGIRTLLSSITESGWDTGVGTTTLPAIVLSYGTSTPNWTEQGTRWTLPDYFYPSSPDMGWRTADVNSDGLVDVLQSYVYDGGSINQVYLNNGTSTWTLSSWTAPMEFVNFSVDYGMRFAEVNGDGYIDLVQGLTAGSDTKTVYLNNGTSTWTASSTLLFPMTITNTNNADLGVRMVDINGDGLDDIAQSYSGTHNVYINNGSGWTGDTAWVLPSTDFTNGTNDNGFRFADVNNDGLTDIVRAYGTYGGADHNVYINNGHGWTEDVAWGATILESFTGGSGDTGLRLADVNGDGLVDMTIGSYTYDPGLVFYSKVKLNTGSGWTLLATTTGWTTPTAFGFDQNNYGAQYSDVDGDGRVDVIRGYTGNDRSVYIKNGSSTPDVLKQIANEKGGKTSIAYQGSPQYQGSAGTMNPKLPFVLNTVKTITLDSGFGAISTTTYSYAGGEYYFNSATPADRKFTGFASTTKTNDLGHTVRTFFHQGNSSDSSNGEFNDNIAKAGKPYRIEVADGTTTSANIFSRTINKWARADYGDGRNFVKLIQSLMQTYDGDSSSHKDTAASTTYSDTTGNVTEAVNLGEVLGNSDGTFTDTGTDLASTTYTYAASSTNSTMSYPSQELVKDQSGTTVKDTKWTYDGLSFGSVSSGNQTKEEKLISGSTYASTSKTYNSYGLVTQFTDPRGATTSYDYDTYNMYPATTTNALAQTIAFVYDYSSGKVATSTDENNKTLTTDYDGLDRPTKEKQPDFITSSTLVTRTTYTYTDSTSTPSSVLRSDYLSSATTTDSYTYVDGWGRTLQTKKEAESANGWATRDIIYNNIGSVDQESLPYFNANSTYGSATTAAALYSVYRYDPAGRVLTVSDALGTTTNVYSDWRLAVTDALSNKKEMVKDAYGNLANVIEYVSAGSPATTTYAWNLLGKLTKITDALANVRNFTYDNLGRLTGSEDLHASGDTTYGTTSRQYDAAGNLIQMYSPNGIATTYTYDVLNRIKTEDATSSVNTVDITYIYDGCTNGKNRPCQAIKQGSATTTYTYNPNGLVATEAKRIVSTSATTTFSYYRNGALDTIIYPDTASTTYVYDDAGLLDKISRKEKNAATSSVITRITWSPLEQITALDQANGVNSTSTYDQTKRYRLNNKYTRLNASTILQNIDYTYDAVGNILTANDIASTSVRKSVTYTYDGLYRLLSASTTAVATSSSSYNHTFTYDALGNLGTKATNTLAYSGAGFANPDAMTSFGQYTFAYDNAGNMTNQNGVSTSSYAYDWQNKMSSSTAPGLSEYYRYDHDGSRVYYATGTQAIPRLFWGKHYDTWQTKTQKHIFVGSQLVATVETIGSTKTPNYVISDHLGGTTMLTNSSGSIVQSNDYLPFGDMRINTKTGAFEERKKFTGHTYDAETDLNYMGARYQRGYYGRFLSQDPVASQIADSRYVAERSGKPYEAFLADPQQHNLYSYVTNNPVRYNDPTGEIAPVVAIGILAVATFLTTPATANAPASASSLQTSAGERYLPWVGAVMNPVKGGVKIAEKLSEKAINSTVQRGTRALAGVAERAAAAYMQQGERNVVVYIGYREGQATYVGITNNLMRRESEHQAAKAGIRLQALPGSFTRNEARGLEQLIKNNNPQFENKINSISPMNPMSNTALNWAEGYTKQNNVKLTY